MADTDSLSGETAGSDQRKTTRWRGRFPLIVISVVAVVLLTVWGIEHDDVDRAMRTVVTALVVMLASVVLFLWFVLLSGFAGRMRVLWAVLMLAVVGAFVGSIRRVEFTGDMTPILTFRWEGMREDALEAHRAATPSAADGTAIETAEIGPLDIPEYRGRNRDGVIVGPPLSREWSTSAPPERWRQPVGGGYASFAVVGNSAITIEQRREDEAIVSYDTASGAEQWVHRYPALFAERMGGNGPRATPTVHEDKVVSLGATGELVCLDRATGEVRWTVNILEDNGVPNIEWGMSGSPLVVDGLVIVSPGAQKGGQQSAAVVAYDLESGERRWAGGKTQASYASPVAADLDGVRQVLQFDAAGLTGYDIVTGESLWHHEWISDYDTNAAQPVVLSDDRVFISSASGAALLQIVRQDDEWSVTQLWKNRNLKSDYANIIEHNGFLYGLDKGILVCVEIATGDRMWKRGRYGHGQILLSRDLLVILSEKGELILVEAVPDEHRERARFPAIEGRTWNNHVLVDGVIYVRNHLEMASYDLRAKRSPPTE